MRFEHLSYANSAQPRLTQWVIRSIENLSGRDHYAELYDVWRREIAPTRDRIFGRMLELIDVRFDLRGNWPVADLPEGPLVIIANHPFGIGDGIAVLSLAESLGRPFRVLMHNDLMRVPEMADYALPVSFDENREAMEVNMRTRKEAMRLLAEGVTIVIFPAGGVATAPKGFGQAEDLPWKMFPARLVQAARAHVLPVHFHGQNGRLFHLASRVSMTLRTSLLIREFRRLSGTRIIADVGEVMRAEDLAGISDRKALLAELQQAVFKRAMPEIRLAG
ncbi:glycerol acyltransferase [Pseudohoeflea suaedae]|uniref:Glycerol acyltransferase n=1 Tax=Pseudohoeflea suaedae TaxID=877384 RepID=A0A4R5PRP2_9HYPH|nr:lysophospholipid acyltransferase family protein [Pseudohoeflea suaedae]TDH39257.1 glycerol acyltransferase [Pseudohoeflea suaedae]